MLLTAFGSQQMCREVLDCATGLRSHLPPGLQPQLIHPLQHPTTVTGNLEGAHTGLSQDIANIEIDDIPGPPRPDGGPAPAGQRRRQGGSASSLLRCTMCPDGDAHSARDSRGLLQHMVRMHLGQAIPQQTIEQLRDLGKEAFRICSTIRARTSPQCAFCRYATPTRPLQLGDIIPDRRRGPQTSMVSASPQTPTPPSATHGGVQQQPPSDDPDTETQSAQGSGRRVQISLDAKREATCLRRDSTLKCVPICVAGRMCTGMAESIEGCLAADENWAFLARFRARLLLAHVPKGIDTNEELKRRLSKWERCDFDGLVRHVLAQQLRDGSLCSVSPP